MKFEILRPVLLTGAGFTKDVGGFLAHEMWAQIFNSPTVQSQDRLTDLLKEDFDYESVYDKVTYGRYTAQEKAAIAEVLLVAHRRMDDRVRNLEGNQTPGSGVDLDKLQALIQKFSGSGNKRGYFFTLNQDLFIERWFSGRVSLLHGKAAIWTPGVSNQVSERAANPLAQEDFLTLPQEDTMPIHHRRNNEDGISVYGRFQYIKLHGSWNWRTSDGKSAMAIGLAKSRLLESEPLLRWYLDTFRSVILEKDRRLLVIGYSFRDPHINDVIAEGIEEHDLSLFIVSPQPPDSFRNMLIAQARGIKHRKKACGMLFWDGLAGYFQASLSQVCSRDGYMHLRETDLAKQICDAVFG